MRTRFAFFSLIVVVSALAQDPVRIVTIGYKGPVTIGTDGTAMDSRAKAKGRASIDPVNGVVNGVMKPF
jgi:hypothetical protein